MKKCEQSILKVPQLIAKFFRFERRMRYETSGKGAWVAEKVTKQPAMQLKPSNVFSNFIPYNKVSKSYFSFKV